MIYTTKAELKCILPSKGTLYDISFIWHSEKQLQGQEIDQWLSETGSEWEGIGTIMGMGELFGVSELFFILIVVVVT